MKRILITMIVALTCLAADAITLFPHFVDVAGDYNDGTTAKFIDLNLPTRHWREAPSWYKDIKSADDFLQDTLPTSSYVINREEETLSDGTKIIIYTSLLEADGLNKDKWSKLILIQTPGEPLYVGIQEDEL